MKKKTTSSERLKGALERVSKKGKPTKKSQNSTNITVSTSTLVTSTNEVLN